MQHKLQLSSWPGITLTTLVLGALGCSGGSQSRIEAADWDPKKASESAIAELDKDGDGQLSMDELAAAPGLEYCVKLIDTNEDNQLSAEEIFDKVKEYKEMRVGLVSFNCKVTLDGRPMEGLKVRLVPEPFLGAGLKTIESTSKGGGMVDFIDEELRMSVAPVGMYRVEVTSPNVEIPAKYNTATMLGVAVSSTSDPYHEGLVVFRIKKK